MLVPGRPRIPCLSAPADVVAHEVGYSLTVVPTVWVLPFSQSAGVGRANLVGGIQFWAGSFAGSWAGSEDARARLWHIAVWLVIGPLWRSGCFSTDAEIPQKLELFLAGVASVSAYDGETVQ